MNTSTICICGAGTMGGGIAQVAATAGFLVLLYDVSAAGLQRAAELIRSNLTTMANKGKLNADDVSAILQRIQFVSQIEQCKADVVIEAIVESLEAKRSLFLQLAEINGSNTVLASNTSSISLTAIADGLPNPDRVAGLHFFNPAPLMKLVEVVKAEQTSEETMHTLVELAKAFGKTPVACNDSPGFIVNRVARPYYIEALRLAEEGQAAYEVIDRIMEGIGFKMGAFKLMDLIGNDVNYAVSCSVYEQLGQPERLKPSFLQKEKVDSGELGKKSGAGYYQY